jgi:hypothetical protein
MRRFTALPLLVSLVLASQLAHAEEPSRTEGVAPNDREQLRASIDELAEKRFLHGFRLGYAYLMNINAPVDSRNPSSQTMAEKYGIRTPHEFLIGYEVTFRLVGHDWLNVLFVSNAMVSGLEQSKIFPSLNSLIGFELGNTFQAGVGVNLMPVMDKPAHMMVAAGWTPRVGDFYTPIHAFYVPDVDGQSRMGVTLGVNW